LPIKPAKPVVVIILTCNQREVTLRCLASLMAAESTPPTVLVWDNGSQDGTAEAVRSAYPTISVHISPHNLGVAAGRNAAATLAIETHQPPYLLFLDNDMRLEPHFVSALLDPLAQSKSIGQTQAKLRLAHDPLRLNDGGGCRINFVLGETRPVGFGEVDRGQYDTPRQCVACGGAMAVRTEVFQQLGGFDTRFNPFGPEDLDFSLRLKRAGYEALFIPSAIAYHEISHTFGAGYTEDYARHKARHWLLFMRRHASPLQVAGFLLLGAPYRVSKLLVREMRRGNGGALRGLLRGLTDFVTAAAGTRSK
jgi:GT2 family glycosyltransferase